MELQIHLLQVTYPWITDQVLMDAQRMPLARYYQLIRVAAERKIAEDKERRQELIWLAKMVASATWSPEGLVKEQQRLDAIYGESAAKTAPNDHADSLSVASKIIARREAARRRVASN